jgi:hypothetical protein
MPKLSSSPRIESSNPTKSSGKSPASARIAANNDPPPFAASAVSSAASIRAMATENASAIVSPWTVIEVEPFGIAASSELACVADPLVLFVSCGGGTFVISRQR